MKVILLKDVKKVGKANEVVEVSDGYARNFLFRGKLAVPFTDKSKVVLEQHQELKAIKNEEIKEEAIALKEKIEALTLEFSLKLGTNDRVFGSVSTKQIADKLNKKHDIKIDKRKIQSDALSGLGYFKIKTNLHKDVEATITVHITEKGN